MLGRGRSFRDPPHCRDIRSRINDVFDLVSQCFEGAALFFDELVLVVNAPHPAYHMAKCAFGMVGIDASARH